MIDLSKIQTPCFVLDSHALIKHVNDLKQAILKYWPNTIIGYSVKTNSLPFLATLLKERGIWAETVSIDEYELMRMCGYPSNEIICNGPIKDENYVSTIIEGNSILNIDSSEEQRILLNYRKTHNGKIKVGVRVNLNVSEFNPDSHQSRFGFCYENGELEKLIKSLQNNGIDVVGLHLHTGVLHGTLEKYEWLISKFSHIISELKIDTIEYIDLGGGYYGWMDDKPSWEEYLRVISNSLLKSGFSSERLRLVLEPGASLFAGAFSYYTRITDIKKANYDKFCFCDGSRIHIDPLMHKSSYIYEHIPGNNEEKVNGAILVGFTCMEEDRIMPFESESVAIGDIVIFKKVGSYCSTLSPLFISYFPNVYSYDSHSQQIECVREKWTAKEFVQKCKY